MSDEMIIAMMKQSEDQSTHARKGPITSDSQENSFTKKIREINREKKISTKDSWSGSKIRALQSLTKELKYYSTTQAI